MKLPKRYNPRTAEPDLQTGWQENGVFHYDPASQALRFTIDTPPATVSGNLHLGHVYSYSHTDFIARFQRMNGRNVYYPMGFDDNGLPTERLVERLEGISAQDVGREAFIERCFAISEEAEEDYRALWQRLGLSIDWRYSYRTIGEHARKLAQWSFLDLYEKGLLYRQKAPAIWCPECQTAIAQAELNDLERESTFYSLDFRLPDGTSLPIATTRPELLPACVAVFVHPEDGRFQAYIGQEITIPYFQRAVPLLADEGADPEKGTGAVMCCTFGDTADVNWWRTHNLPLIEAMGRNGRLTESAAPFANLTGQEARQAIISALQESGELLGSEPIAQTIRTHERCDTAVEYIVTQQWFVKVLDFKEELLAAGEQIAWHPAHMKNRYTQWVENLGWDWCISRQRYFGVPIPVWTCADCGTVHLPDEAQLPINPLAERPFTACSNCQSVDLIPEGDVFDTWFTSSLTPQIAGQFDLDNDLYAQTYPFTMRPQAHEIIRTWAFYTILKSMHHFGILPFSNVAISGWGLAAAGTEKLSKSRGGGGLSPQEMIAKYSADAVRYWTASTAIGKDAIIDEAKIDAGAKLVTKLWNVARFSQRFLADYDPSTQPQHLTLADRWLLAQTDRLMRRVTAQFEKYDYASAKSETEQFFWRVLADNYLEMAKMRLYGGGAEAEGARFALYHALLTTLKLVAPILPHITERIYTSMFAQSDGAKSIHRAAWPLPNAGWRDDTAVSHGECLVEIATAVRRYKSQQNLGLGSELSTLYLRTKDADLGRSLLASEQDLQSITRAQTVALNAQDGAIAYEAVGSVEVGILL